MKNCLFSAFLVGSTFFCAAQKSWSFGVSASAGPINFDRSVADGGQKFTEKNAARLAVFSTFRIAKNWEATTALRIDRAELKHLLMLPTQTGPNARPFVIICWGDLPNENQHSTLQFWEAPVGATWLLENRKFSPTVSGSFVFGGLQSVVTRDGSFFEVEKFKTRGVSRADLAFGGEAAIGCRWLFLGRMELSARGVYRKMSYERLGLTSDEIGLETAVGCRF